MKQQDRKLSRAKWSKIITTIRKSRDQILEGCNYCEDYTYNNCYDYKSNQCPLYGELCHPISSNKAAYYKLRDLLAEAQDLAQDIRDAIVLDIKDHTKPRKAED